MSCSRILSNVGRRLATTGNSPVPPIELGDNYKSDCIGFAGNFGAVVCRRRSGAAIAAPPPPPLVDWDKIQIKTTDLGNKTYMLEGQGGNITVAVGTDGIIMVDGQFAPLSDKIKAAIKAISPLPIKYMVNTHYHGDHTGGNENFAKDGVVIVAHDNIRVRLAAGTKERA